MAVDKLVDSTQLDADLTSVANAIRTKGGTSAQLLFPSEFVSAINAISTGGGKTLLADYTTSEDVSAISISDNSAFMGYDFYVLEAHGSLSTTEWVYLGFNNITQRTSYMGVQAGSNKIDAIVPITTSPVTIPDFIGSDERLAYIARLASGPGSVQESIGSGLTEISLRLYYNTSLFIAGCNVKLWGIKI